MHSISLNDKQKCSWLSRFLEACLRNFKRLHEKVFSAHTYTHIYTHTDVYSSRNKCICSAIKNKKNGRVIFILYDFCLIEYESDSIDWDRIQSIVSILKIRQKKLKGIRLGHHVVN